MAQAIKTLKGAREHGSIAVEMLLLLPCALLLFVVLLSFAKIVNLKQQANHLARFAAYEHAISGQAGHSTATRALVVQEANWNFQSSNGGGSPGDVMKGGPDGGSAIAGLLSQALRGASLFGDVRYEVNGTSTTVNLPSLAGMGVGATHTLPVGFWTHDGCGSLISLARGVAGW